MLLSIKSLEGYILSNYRSFWAGVLVFILIACQTPPTATITAVQINANLNILPSGKTSALVASVTGIGAFDPSVTWSIVSGGGSLSSNEGASIIYTAPIMTQDGNTIIRATSKADTSKQAAINVKILPPVIAVTIDPTTVSLAQNQDQNFTATVTGSSNTGVTWVVNPASGTTLTPNGNTVTFRSSVAGNYSVTATSVADESKSASASVTVSSGGTGGNGAFKAIAAGDSHSLALKNDGTIIGWGSNGSGSGQTTVPTGLTGVTAIAAGAFHSLALKNDGTVIAWGSIKDVPSNLSNVKAIVAGGFRNIALRIDGTICEWSGPSCSP